jgi:hypothetical protein
MKHRYGIVFQKVDNDRSSSDASSAGSYVAVIAKKAYPVAAEQLPWDMVSSEASTDEADLEAGETSALCAAAAASATGKPEKFVV